MQRYPKIKLNILAWLAMLAVGCGSSGSASNPITPVQAQVPSAPGPQRVDVDLGGVLADATGQSQGVLSLDLQVVDGSGIAGHALLSRGENFTPYVVQGDRPNGPDDPDNRAVLTLYPEDQALTESLEVDGSLTSGGTMEVRETGGTVLGRVTLSDRGPAQKVYNANTSGIHGRGETYEVHFSSAEKGAIDPYKQAFTLQLVFNEGGTWYRRGTFENTRQSAGADDVYTKGVAQANFYVFTPTIVRIDMEDIRVVYIQTYGEREFTHDAGSLYFRVNDNSFFSGGFEGESVPLRSDSFIRTKKRKIYTDPNSFIKLLNKGT